MKKRESKKLNVIVSILVEAIKSVVEVGVGGKANVTVRPV